MADICYKIVEGFARPFKLKPCVTCDDWVDWLTYNVCCAPGCGFNPVCIAAALIEAGDEVTCDLTLDDVLMLWLQGQLDIPAAALNRLVDIVEPHTERLPQDWEDLFVGLIQSPLCAGFRLPSVRVVRDMKVAPISALGPRAFGEWVEEGLNGLTLASHFVMFRDGIYDWYFQNPAPTLGQLMCGGWGKLPIGDARDAVSVMIHELVHVQQILDAGGGGQEATSDYLTGLFKYGRDQPTEREAEGFENTLIARMVARSPLSCAQPIPGGITLSPPTSLSLSCPSARADRDRCSVRESRVTCLIGRWSPSNRRMYRAVSNRQNTCCLPSLPSLRAKINSDLSRIRSRCRASVLPANDEIPSRASATPSSSNSDRGSHLVGPMSTSGVAEWVFHHFLHLPVGVPVSPSRSRRSRYRALGPLLAKVLSAGRTGARRHSWLRVRLR